MDRIVAFCFLDDELLYKSDPKSLEYNLNADDFLDPINEFVFLVLVGPLMFESKQTLFCKGMIGGFRLSKLLRLLSQVLSRIMPSTINTSFSADHS